jgi:hypothetical protein
MPMTDDRVSIVLEATKPTQLDRVELFKLGRSLVGPRLAHSRLLELVNDACEVAYVPSREFSMDLTINQVLVKAHDDAQVDRLSALRNIIIQRVSVND